MVPLGVERRVGWNERCGAATAAYAIGFGVFEIRNFFEVIEGGFDGEAGWEVEIKEVGGSRNLLTGSGGAGAAHPGEGGFFQAGAFGEF